MRVEWTARPEKLVQNLLCAVSRENRGVWTGLWGGTGFIANPANLANPAG